MATASTDGAQQATTTQADGTTTQSIVNMHRYKMQPPTFTGEYGTFEEWKYKFQAWLLAAQRWRPSVRPYMSQAWEMVDRWSALTPVNHRVPVPEVLVKAMCAIAWHCHDISFLGSRSTW